MKNPSSSMSLPVVYVALVTSISSIVSYPFKPSVLSRPEDPSPSVDLVAPFFPKDDEPPKAALPMRKMCGLSTSSSESFEVGINRVNEGPKEVKGENGSGRVITSTIRMQFNDEVVVVLPFSGY